MRILLSIAYADMTGEVRAVHYAGELIARGHHVFIVSDAEHGTTSANHAPIQLGSGSLWRTGKSVLRLVALIRRHRIQVVHAHSASVRWATWLATRFTGVPMVSTTHANAPLSGWRRFSPAWGEFAVSVSANTRGTMPSHTVFPARSAGVVPLAVGGRGAFGVMTGSDRGATLASPFSDTHFVGQRFDWDVGYTEIGNTMLTGAPSTTPVEQLRSEPLVSAVERLEQVYRSAYVNAVRHEIPILCYHRLIERDEDGGTVDTHLLVDRFEAQLRYLRDHGYRTLHFADFDNRQVFENTQRAVVLTFDDGYEDNYRLLFPLLKKYNAKAVIYLVSGRRRNDWDIRNGEMPLRLLSQEERREMLESGLVEFGAHTVTHPDLRTLNPTQASAEIRQSKAQLEAELGVPVQTFAYPYGHLSAQAKEIVRNAGFRYALATNSGPVAIHEDAFHVRRIVVFPSITMKRFKRKVSGRYVQRTTANRADEHTLSKPGAPPTPLVRR